MPKTKTNPEEEAVPEDEFEDQSDDELEPSEDELDDDWSDEDEDLDDDLDDDVDDDDDDDDDGDDEDQEALDELEAEELEMLTEDEASETLVVDEAAEMRAIRRAEIALSASGEERAQDEFLCQSCFLLKKSSQLADKRRQLCNDCA